jgi:hypothetical protein
LGCAVLASSSVLAADERSATPQADSCGERLPGGEVRRRRPGDPAALDDATPDCDSTRLPRATAGQLPDLTPIPDRWPLVDALGYRVDHLDAYHGNNLLKGDRPIVGSDFLDISAVSGTLIEDRDIPTAGALGDGKTRTQFGLFFNQSVTLDTVFYRGDTVFAPPDWQWRFTAELSEHETSAAGETARTTTAALQALWFEKHLRDVSVQDDFDSVRVGIQTVTSDFRGFLFSDTPVAARLFGTRAGNTYQYNLMVLRSFRRDDVSLNDVGAPLPDDTVLLGNLYRQDFPLPGVTSEAIGVYDRNRQPGTQQILGTDGSPNQAPAAAKHNYDVAYVGYGIDGHFGRLNTTFMAYGLFGSEQERTFAPGAARIEAAFAAGELSLDVNNHRWRVSLLHATGDSDLRGNRATGFDGLTASPVFAGTDSSFFIHQELALAGGTFNLKSRNALLPTLNPAADAAQADFSNPGLDLIGVGLDWDMGPAVRLSVDANQLWFDRTAVLAQLTMQPLVPRAVGEELALNAFWRPFINQNVVVRASDAALLRGPAYRALYTGGLPTSAFVLVTLAY